jgi:hypothetical protein
LRNSSTDSWAKGVFGRGILGRLARPGLNVRTPPVVCKRYAMAFRAAPVYEPRWPAMDTLASGAQRSSPSMATVRAPCPRHSAPAAPTARAGRWRSSSCSQRVHRSALRPLRVAVNGQAAAESDADAWTLPPPSPEDVAAQREQLTRRLLGACGELEEG